MSSVKDNLRQIALDVIREEKIILFGRTPQDMEDVAKAYSDHSPCDGFDLAMAMNGSPYFWDVDIDIANALDRIIHKIERKKSIIERQTIKI